MTLELQSLQSEEKSGYTEPSPPMTRIVLCNKYIKNTLYEMVSNVDYERDDECKKQ